MIDRIHGRFPELHPGGEWERAVYSISVYESMVCFRIDREKCFVSSPTSNDGIASDARDFRHSGTQLGKLGQARGKLGERFAFLKDIRPIRALQRALFASIVSCYSRFRSRRLKKCFRA